MDNFDFLSKNELSYILNNERKFGKQLVQQIEDYCQRKNYSPNEIKEKNPEWNKRFNRLNFKTNNEELIILKSEESKRQDRRGFLFVIIAIVFIILFAIKDILTTTNYGFNFWYPLLILPFIFYLFYDVVRQRKNIKSKFNKIREVKILKSSSVQLLENGVIIFEGEINAVNLFCTEVSPPNVILEFKMQNETGFRIDETGNYLESLKSGNEIVSVQPTTSCLPEMKDLTLRKKDESKKDKIRNVSVS